MRTFHLLTAMTFVVALSTAGAASAAPSPKGVWIDDTGRGGVEIKDCGGKLCGHLVWFKDSAELKNCGKQILGDVAPMGDNTWDNGWIYDPDKKQKFDLELKPLSPDKLQVKGYAGLKLFNKTMVWNRAPADLARCDATKTNAASAPPPGANEKAPASASEPPPSKEAAAPAPERKPAAEPPAADAERTARAETKAEDESARGEPGAPADDSVADSRPKKDCKLEVPYVTLTFPCKD